jgi:hypothetical protein
MRIEPYLFYAIVWLSLTSLALNVWLLLVVLPEKNEDVNRLERALDETQRLLTKVLAYCDKFLKAFNDEKKKNDAKGAD